MPIALFTDVRRKQWPFWLKLSCFQRKYWLRMRVSTPISGEYLNHIHYRLGLQVKFVKKIARRLFASKIPPIPLKNSVFRFLFAAGNNPIVNRGQ
jgi:hypothetical protein